MHRPEFENIFGHLGTNFSQVPCASKVVFCAAVAQLP
jgi:hypothetical protein